MRTRTTEEKEQSRAQAWADLGFVRTEVARLAQQIDRALADAGATTSALSLSERIIRLKSAAVLAGDLALQVENLRDDVVAE